MIRKQFKVTLLTDVILNQKAASEGPNETLDYIPGTCFLGIAASSIYADSPKESIEIFHGKNVRFGDAHPMLNGNRTLRVPASLFYPKLSSASEECYVHHLIAQDETLMKSLLPKQLKQCRMGFYDLTKNPAALAITSKSLAIKSAHDREKRTSKDKKLYCYESLNKGVEFLFDVYIHESVSHLAPKIEQSLLGNKHIGRSRSAQYGLVKIEKTAFDDYESSKCSEDMTIVYADSRLIFIDKSTGLPTLTPTPKDFGIEDGKILWNLCQVRTFQFAPWNFKRQCFDSDRCGFEKGSVFVIKGRRSSDAEDFVGSFLNEGYGHIIGNPKFLSDSFGVKLADKQAGNDRQEEYSYSSDLIEFLLESKNNADLEYDVINKVNTWVIDNTKLFKEAQFKSQWGTIRKIATLAKSKDQLMNMLFGADGYVKHGVAKDRWEEQNRTEALRNFIKGFKSDTEACLAVVNLAAEMAKRLGKEDCND